MVFVVISVKSKITEKKKKKSSICIKNNRVTTLTNLTKNQETRAQYTQFKNLF
jgi:hypothetical protein